MGMFLNTSHQSLGSLQLISPCTVSEFSNLQITPWRGGEEKQMGRKGRKGRALDEETASLNPGAKPQDDGLRTQRKSGVQTENQDADS